MAMESNNVFHAKFQGILEVLPCCAFRVNGLEFRQVWAFLLKWCIKRCLIISPIRSPVYIFGRWAKGIVSLPEFLFLALVFFLFLFPISDNSVIIYTVALIAAVISCP